MMANHKIGWILLYNLAIMSKGIYWGQGMAWKRCSVPVDLQLSHRKVVCCKYFQCCWYNNLTTTQNPTTTTTTPEEEKKWLINYPILYCRAFAMNVSQCFILLDLYPYYLPHNLISFIRNNKYEDGVEWEWRRERVSKASLNRKSIGSILQKQKCMS